MNEYGYDIGEKISLTCFFICLYFVFLPLDFVSVGGFGSVSKIFAILPMVTSVIRIGSRIRVKKDPIVFWMMFFLFMAILSCVFSVNRDISNAAIRTPLLNVIMIFVIAACQDYNNREIRMMTSALVIGSWLAIIMVIFFGVSPYGRTTIMFGDSRQDQNGLCGFMLFAFVYHMKLYSESKKVIHIILLCIIATAVMLTGSRGGLLAYIAVVIFYFFLRGKESKHKVKNTILFIIGVSIMTAVIIYFVMPRLDSVLISRFSVANLMEGGATGRFELWKHFLSVYKNSTFYRQLIGHGYGTTQLISLNGLVAHNLYIDNLITTGAIGFLATIGMHASCIKNGVKRSPYFTCVMVGLITMCFSLSLTSYKPLWSTIIMLIIMNDEKTQERGIKE